MATAGKDAPMAQTISTVPPSPTRKSGAELMADLNRLRAEVRANNPDMTEDDWETPADRWAEDVNEGPRERVRRGRGETT